MGRSNYNVEQTFDDVYHKILSYVISGNRPIGDLPIYIQPFPIEHNAMVESQIALLSKRLGKNDVKTLHIDIYKVAIELLNADGILDLILENEADMSKQDLHLTLNSNLTPELIFDYMRDMWQKEDYKLVLISGWGLVYPYIRANTILNCAELLAKEISLVFFYPGHYNNESLVLFDKIKEDNYYRAHNLDKIK